MKICSRCNQEKDESQFYKKIDSRNGLCPYCKDCTKSYHHNRNMNKRSEIAAYHKLYVANNASQRKEYAAKYYQTNKKEILLSQKDYVKVNKIKIKKYRTDYRKNNKQIITEKRKQYYTKNKETRIQYGILYKRSQYKNNPQFALLGKLRSRIHSALKNAKNARKSNPTLKLIGCDIPALMKCLETKFLPGMTWDNFGQWHIDHIIPCSTFNLEDVDEQKKCFHYTNLQPLWAIDNLKKGNRIS